MANDDWTTMPFTEAVLVNPPVRLTRGTAYPFVEMAAVDPSARSVHESEIREFKGGGARFIPGDTLMARITPCLENGKIARFRPTDGTSPGFGSTEFIVIRGRDDVTDNDFAYYLTKWSEFRQFAISQMTGSSGRQRVPTSSLAHFEVTIPPIPVQRRIAHILGTLDDKIELNRRMNRTLEKMAQAIFKSWFIDFDPVIDNALIAGNPIPDEFMERAEVRRTLLERKKCEVRSRKGENKAPSHFNPLFPHSFEDSEIGPIPRGWQVTTFGDLCLKPQYGYTASAVDDPVGPRFLRITDINKQPWIEWHSVPYCEVPSEKKGKYLLKRGDILIARMADPGHGVLIEEDLDAVFASYLIRFRPKDEVFGRYIQYWLRSQTYWNLIHGRKSGSTRATLNAMALSELPVLRPSRKVLGAFESYINPLRMKVVANVSQCTYLARIRDTLLPKLLSGEIELNEDKVFEETSKC